MEQRSLVCISCPIGCRLEITMEHSKVIQVSGQSCNKGKAYGIKECTNPTRILSTTVEVQNGYPVVASVKTQSDIPKEKLFDCIRQLKNVKLTAPVHIGDVILYDIAGTGVNIVATTNCELVKE